MNRFGAHSERRQRARKEHVCWGSRPDRPCVIKPGDVYIVGVTLPGAGAYSIGGGDYETVDWPFGWVKVCHAHWLAEYVDGDVEDLEAIKREEWEAADAVDA
jgi:hypothetical protein